MILSKLFLPEGRIWRVKRNEDKKAGKKRRKRSKRKFGMVLAKSKFKSKVWLMRMHQSEILYIVTWNLYQNVAAMLKSALLANFGQN